MAKKKKKKLHPTSKAAEKIKADIAEEILALEAIYADDFSLHNDGIGFQLLVVPHPGLGDNYCSVELHVRYTAGYPATPLQLKLRNEVGLRSEDVQQLTQQLQDTAAVFAQQECVCVFNLVDDCQEFLREHNEAAAAVAQASAAAAPHGGAGAGAGGASEEEGTAASLWHEMQRRQQAEAAALEADSTSVGPGLQGPGGMLGDDLWMFDGGLFAEEGEPSFALPNLNTTQQPAKGGRRSKAPAVRPDISPEPLYRLATSPKTPSMMDKARTIMAAGKSPKASAPQLKATGGPAAAAAAAQAAGAGGAAGGLKAAAAAAMAGASSSTQQGQVQAAADVSRPQQSQVQQPGQQEDTAAALQQSQQQQQDGAVGGRAGGLKLLLSHSHSCSFSNLPKELQQLLNSGDNKRRKGRHRHKHRLKGDEQQQQQRQPPQAQGLSAGAAPQAAGAAAAAVAAGLKASGRVESLVFGDIDSSVYRRLSSDSTHSGPTSSKAQGSGQPQSKAGLQGGSGGEPGEVFKSCMPDDGASNSSDSSSSSSSSSDGYESDSSSSSRGGSRLQQASGARRSAKQQQQAGSSDSTEAPSAEEEGAPSLRSQLLLGHLLLLAANAVGGAAGGHTAAMGPDSSGTTDTAKGSAAGLAGPSNNNNSSTSSLQVLQPGSLQMLAGHLRRSGLLPKWVFWLLKQLPQRPELYERAFNRLFQQEIQECSTAPSTGQQPHPSQVLKLFWDRQAAAAAAGSTFTASTMSATADTLSSSDPTSTSTAAAGGLLAASAGMRTGSGAAAAAAAATAAAATLGQQQQQQQLLAAASVSRYRSDFQELSRLGQGGFGIVVAAVNRLDGRKYAVKKIRLQPGGSSSSYSRILREVATLSRLQHPNVVRYYQAWTEQAQAEDADVDAEPSDGGEWGDLSDSEDLSSTEDESSSSSSSSPSSSEDEDEGGSSTQPGDSTSYAAATTATSYSTATAADGSDSGSGSGSSSSSSDSSDSGSEDDDGSEAGLFGDPSISIPPRLPVPVRARRKPAVKGATQKQAVQQRKAKSSSAARRRSRPAGPSQILYIQMEFCPRTLAQVLEAGVLEEVDAWLVLRGILAGLAHIHSQGAIHRDLKPQNIFYGSTGEVKLGDFGLAKFQAQQASQAGLDADMSGGGAEVSGSGSPRLTAQQRLSSLGGIAAMSAAAPSDLTGVCGTGFYISPEIANGWASYDEKVDLYSLGVVVFEMWSAPFSTAMERAVLLRELREAGKMPPGWEAAHPQVARLVRWLMSPKPADRPTARQVLTSDLLPPRLEDEQLKDLLRSLPDNEIAYERVVESLFSISTGREPQAAGLGPSAAAAAAAKGAAGSGGGAASTPAAAAAAASRAVQALTPARAAAGMEGLRGAGLLSSQQGVLPLGELPGAPVDAHLDKEEEVVKVVRDVATLHGAVHMSSAPLGLSHLGLPRDAVRFLAPSGAVVALRYEVRYPLAAWFAQQAALAAAGTGGGGYYSNGFGSSGSGSLGLGGSPFGTVSALEHGLKRWEVCRVQRAGRGGRGLPASYLTADFDIISPSGVGTGGAGRERLLAEAEVVKVVTQVLDALPELGPYEIRLGHTQVLAAAITGMALPPGVSPASVMALLASAAAVSAAHNGTDTAAAATGTTAGGSSSSTGGALGPGGAAAAAAGAALGGLSSSANEAGAGGAAGGGGGGGGHGAASTGAGSSTGEGGGGGGGAGGGAAGRAHTWPAIRAGLDGMGLDSTPVSRCRQCVLQLPGPLFSQLSSLRSFLRELRPLLGSAGTTAALTAVDELQALGQLLLDWGVARDQLLLEPLLTPQAEYFSGTLFQVLLQSHSHHHSYQVIHTSAVAGGGRYDTLLRSLWSPAAATLMPAPGAVGVTLNCEKLVKMLTALQRRQQHRAGVLGAAGGGGGHGGGGGLTGLLLEGGGRQPGSQCDVLVCARGGDGRLQTRMGLLAQLWAAGISAQMLPREGPTLAEQYEYADACGAKWLVIIDDKTTGPSQGFVRVKRWRRGPDDSSGSTGRLRRGEDSSVHVIDVARFLQLGLSGAQDPSAGTGGAGLTASSGGSHHHHHRSLLHRSGSGGDLRGSRGAAGGGGGGADSSMDSWDSGALPESGGGREGREVHGYYREGAGPSEGRRDRGEQQGGGGRHRDRRR